MVPSGARLKLKTPTIAVVLVEKDRKAAEVIPRGATVELLEPIVEANQLVSVLWAGWTCQMFSTDLRYPSEVGADANL